MSYIYTIFKEYDKVIENYKKAIELNPNDKYSLICLLEINLITNSAFDKEAKEKYIKFFKDNKEKFIAYKMLKIFENIKIQN